MSTSSERTIGARGLLERGLRTAALAAALAAAPALARTAPAQQRGAIAATAQVVRSYLGAGLQTDSAVRPSPRPVARRPVIKGVGVLVVETGLGAATPVASPIADPRGRAALVIQISFVDS